MCVCVCYLLSHCYCSHKILFTPARCIGVYHSYRFKSRMCNREIETDGDRETANETDSNNNNMAIIVRWSVVGLVMSIERAITKHVNSTTFLFINNNNNNNQLVALRCCVFLFYFLPVHCLPFIVSVLVVLVFIIILFHSN